MEKKEKRKSNWKAPVLALVITLVMLAAVMGMAWWYQSSTGMELDPKGMWIANAIGGVIMFLLVYHFVKKPKE